MPTALYLNMKVVTNTMLFNQDKVISSKPNFGTVTLAASDSTPQSKSKADFICDGVNDGEIIQSIIDGFEGASGVIQLANGHYYINKFVQRDGYYYGLYLNKQKREIIIKGMNHNHRYDSTSHMTDKAAVIEVTQSAFDNLPSNQESYVIGSDRTYEFPYKVIGVEDLTIKIPEPTKPLIGIDGAYCSDMHVEHCFMYSSMDYAHPEDLNPNCIAIRGCGQGNIGYNYYMTHIKVVGWGTCYQLAGEHLVMIDCLAQRSAYGFLFGSADGIEHPRGYRTGWHPMTLINCAAEVNTLYGVYFGSGSVNAVEIYGLNFEAVPGQSASWYTNNPWFSSNPMSADDDSNFCGTITYATLFANGDGHKAVNMWDTDAHASKFKTRDLLAPICGATADRPSDPVYLSQYFDTDLNKMLTWNGSSWVY